jgi:hypothetical protein
LCFYGFTPVCFRKQSTNYCFRKQVTDVQSTVTERVKQHRARRALIRVEVEVPTIEDARAVRSFAQQRRNIAGVPVRSGAARYTPQAEPAEALDVLLEAVGQDAMQALRIFIAGLAQARTRNLIVRAERVAANFADAATRQARTRLIGGNDRAGA